MLVNFNGVVNQSMIYDKYLEHSRQNYMDKLIELGIEKKKDNKKLDQNEDEFTQADDNNAIGLKEAQSFNKSLKIMERMIIKNKDSQIYQQYKYLYT